MKILLLFLIVLASCTKQDMHNSLSGIAKTCSGTYHYSVHCDDGRITGLVKAKNPASAVFTVFYTGGEKQITTLFRPPLQLGVFSFSFPIPAGIHLTGIKFMECNQ